MTEVRIDGETRRDHRTRVAAERRPRDLTAGAPAMSGSHLPSLAGVRFAGGAVVFACHAIVLLPDAEPGLLGAGMSMVSMFFVLSGFIMAWAHRPGDTARAFYRRRFARIYPAYFVAVTAAIVVSLVYAGFSPLNLLPYTLIQAWFPDPMAHFAANAVFWSLSCEAFMYAIFPFVAILLHRASARLLWGLAATCTALAVVIGVVATFLWGDPVVQWFVYVFPPMRVPEFLLGVALGFLARKGLRVRMPVWLATVFAVLAVMGASFAPPGLQIIAVTIVPLTLMILALATSDIEERRSFFSHPVSVMLGSWSFSFYLLHGMILAWMILLADVLELPLVLGAVLAFPASLVASWLMYEFVERRFARLLRPRVRAPRLPATLAVSSAT
ncbi:acyltransferase family protein [Microbacterium sp. JZ31]|uniref:acyltransferase family protein n=1 Tax=Microbacterium sp. JZ31 TaxID=1906274 RepID=UPI001932174B|nr:acyltransferase [Microbacterium sp. JZ31]